MSTILTDQKKMQWFIETPTGLIGPFHTPEEANVTKLHEGHNGNIVSRTDSGQSMLLG